MKENLKERLKTMSDDEIKELIPRLGSKRQQLAHEELDVRNRKRNAEYHAYTKSIHEKSISLDEEANKIAREANSLASDANKTANRSLWIACGALILSIIVALCSIFIGTFINNFKMDEG